MIESLQEFAGSFPVWAQWFAIVLVSAIPFVESYFGSVIGVAIGLHPAIAIGAAVVGNVVSMVAFVYGAHAARRRTVGDEEQLTPRREKLRRMFDRFGVPGVSLLGQTMLPSQITAGAMVGFGASRKAVTWWQVLSIVLWGVAFGLLAAGLIRV
ncbi:hypothetical protein ACNI3K_10575 [Demequina sp. SO4-13]|uniref:hypothetical protein n=1 Tax=Demequina sp. SO4-13 TaxID=3401027 RepID=UPI003AF6E346